MEGGFASVIVEWGLVGLVLWLAWSLGWSWRQVTRVRRLVDRRQAAAAAMLVVWVLIFLFPGSYPGFQEFENYIANAYFWLFSGLVLGMAARVPAPAAEAPATPTAS